MGYEKEFVVRRPPFDPRKLMERAVEIMRQSVPEPRSDGKASPLVGAVLWKPDGTVDTAYRGELRYGDHAEYGLLERKNAHIKLDGAILFTTLEPCAPGARRHPKLGCAERIFLARIKEVWVGIEDPDPMVDRKGIKYLQDNGVSVHMFDRDLQETIYENNRNFITQALERAAAMEEESKKPKVVTLSALENGLALVSLDDLSKDAMQRYRSIAKIEDRVGTFSFNRRLSHQGLLMQRGKIFVPTGSGMLLFGKDPRSLMPQAGLLGTIHYPDGTEDLRDFDGPQVLAPEQALRWLRDKLPNPVDRSQARRGEVNSTLFELVREGIVNALIHRDYTNEKAKCQLAVTQNTIMIRSPGMPVEPITLKQMQNFSAPMLSRNPVLHYVFARMELAEERGLGLKSMRDGAHRVGLPLPKYSWETPYLVLTLHRSPAAAVHGLDQTILARLNADEKASWAFIVGQEFVTSPILMKQMNFDERKAQRVLKKLLDVKLLRRVGRGPATRYEVLTS